MLKFVKSNIKKTILSLFLFLYLAVSNLALPSAALAASPPPSAPNAPAEGSWYNQSFDQWYNKVYDTSNPSEIYGERYTAAQVQWVVYSLMAFILNGSLGNSSESQQAIRCFLTNSGDINTCIDSLKSLLGSSKNIPPLAMAPRPKKNLFELIFTDRPISGITYTKNLLNKFDFVPEVSAQTPGFGFDALKPVRNLWKGVRDVSFGLFVLAAIIMSFMIMFRVKISPQVTISIQSAIPKMITALILVTFSYAIAGFLIDFMYIVIGVLSVAFAPMVVGPIGGAIEPTNLFQFLTTGQATDLNLNLGFLGLGFIYIIFFAISFIVFLFLNLGLLGTSLAGVGISFLTAITAGVGPLLLAIVAVIAILVIIWHFIRVFWELVKSFAMVLILTMFAPLQIVAGVVIPNFGFGTWLRSFLSNLSTFVVVGFLTLLAYIFLIQAWIIGFPDTINIDLIVQVLFGSSFSLSGMWDPNLGSAAWPPLLGMGDSTYVIGFLFVIVSFIIFTLIPKAENLVQSFITGKPMGYGTSIGELTGPLGTAAVLYGGTQLAGGALPGFLGRFPGVNRWWEGLEQNRKDSIQQFFKQLKIGGH